MSERYGQERAAGAVTPPRPAAPPAGRYGDLVVTLVEGRDAPLVTTAHSPTLCSVELLRGMAVVHFVRPDLIWVGTTMDGVDVHYRIHGWDTDHKALIIYRDWGLE